MEKLARRSFCGTSLLALPLLSLYAKDKGRDGDDRFDPSEPLMDILADEFTRTTADGAQNGFTAEHFRQYVGHIRIFDAHLEARGTNRELNKRLDDDDFHKLNPVRTAQTTVEYWKKHGIILNENDLAARLSIDGPAYRGIKKAIKKQGGVRMLHASIAEAFERKAKEHESVAFRGDPAIHNGRITFPASLDFSHRPKFMTVQFDASTLMGLNTDCLCRAMIVEGSLLSIVCLIGICAPCCAVAAFMLAIEKFMEGMHMCDPSSC